MPTTFLDVIVVLFWPLALSAAVWIIAIKALVWTDEISEVVQALTRPDGAKPPPQIGSDPTRRWRSNSQKHQHRKVER
jgi:hypothetical protein